MCRNGEIMASFDILKPQVSKVTKSTDNLVITTYGYGGLGKTPVACQMEKPCYLAFGKSGLDGLNNVPFFSIKSWADFKSINKTLCGKKDAEAIHDMYKTIILDEMEILYKYCNEYVCQVNGVTKIKEANSGYGAWGDLKSEWETEILRLLGSGFCIMFILHSAPDDNGREFPVGDLKRMLPIILNHSAIIGYVKGNGVNQESGKPIHSSLMLAGTDEYFARTRNEYFDPVIGDYTAENLIKAYYDALDKQEKAEGVTPITSEEKDKMYESEEVNFDELMEEIQTFGEQLAKNKGIEALTDIVENVLGVGAKASQMTSKQVQAAQVILLDIKSALKD